MTSIPPKNINKIGRSVNFTLETVVATKYELTNIQYFAYHRYENSHILRIPWLNFNDFRQYYDDEYSSEYWRWMTNIS